MFKKIASLFKKSNEDQKSANDRHEGSGQGKTACNNGEVYDGHLMNGKRCGAGVLTCPDGTRYEGSWLNDKLNGTGTVYYPDGSVFRGMFIDGERIDGFIIENNNGTNGQAVRYVRPELQNIKGCEVVLVSYPNERKMQAIKEVREITGYGLALAKDITENVPQWVKKGISLAEAEQIKGRLEEIGGIVEIR